MRFLGSGDAFGTAGRLQTCIGLEGPEGLAAQLGRIGARRVILTHLGPEMLARRAEAAAPCADDGLVVEL